MDIVFLKQLFLRDRYIVRVLFRGLVILRFAFRALELVLHHLLFDLSNFCDDSNVLRVRARTFEIFSELKHVIGELLGFLNLAEERLWHILILAFLLLLVELK